jgi:hypothetical protein
VDQAGNLLLLRKDKRYLDLTNHKELAEKGQSLTVTRSSAKSAEGATGAITILSQMKTFSTDKGCLHFARQQKRASTQNRFLRTKPLVLYFSRVYSFPLDSFPVVG